MRSLIKGNEAIVQAAVMAGCRAYFGYPITPASEIAEAASVELPKAGAVFLQAESEISAIHMVFGAASAGVRVMTASSGPGISLMQEGISYLAGAELPCVIVDIMRGGPGLGNIGAEQGDYFQMVKGGGHGNYRNIVLAPNCVQEMCNLTMHAFKLADIYRNPAVVLADGALGQMMEAIEMPGSPLEAIPKPWAVTGEADTRRNLVTSMYLDHAVMENHLNHLGMKYRELEEKECLWEETNTGYADVLVIAYGITSRLARAAVDLARAQGIKAGLLRPITLYPFPRRAIRARAEKVSSILVVELSNGQMVEDVQLAVNGVAPVKLFNRMGGMIPTAEDILEAISRVGE
jgi:pyruvate/2-oxoacid:ferredoxin oxidoreductase alpha subunit